MNLISDEPPPVGPLSVTPTFDRRNWLPIVALALTLLVTAMLWFLGESWQLLALALLVGIVGIPHGGLDHHVGRGIAQPYLGALWPLAFFASYLLVMAVVLGGWLVLPGPTMILFFVLSAWHFGSDEEGVWPLRILLGGMVIWIPCLARSAEVQSILETLISRPLSLELSLLRPMGWCLGVLFSLGLVVFVVRRRVWTVVRLLGFATLFVTVPVLISFSVFFCLWHSLREIIRIAHLANPASPVDGLRCVAILAAPMTALTLLLALLGGLWLQRTGGLEVAVLQVVFIGLSMLAVPHMLLHAMAGLMDVNALGQRGASGER
jgi:Brp/Blh family beta-carotene 15,15'-monooxygenase